MQFVYKICNIKYDTEKNIFLIIFRNNKILCKSVNIHNMHYLRNYVSKEWHQAWDKQVIHFGINTRQIVKYADINKGEMNCCSHKHVMLCCLLFSLSVVSGWFPFSTGHFVKRAKSREIRSPKSLSRYGRYDREISRRPFRFSFCQFLPCNPID